MMLTLPDPEAEDLCEQGVLQQDFGVSGFSSGSKMLMGCVSFSSLL